MPATSLPSLNNWSSQPELCRDVPWRSRSADTQILCEAVEDGSLWQIRMNEFPEEALYTLLIDGIEAARFDDWPGFWTWPEI